MSDPPADQPAMSPLLAALMDDQFTPELRVRFNQLLRDPQNRDRYLRLIRLHAMLKWRFGSTLRLAAPASPSEGPRVGGRRRLSPALLRYALAALIVLGFAGLAGLLLGRGAMRQGVAAAAPVATLIDSSDAVWARAGFASGSAPFIPGQQLRPGFVRLESGHAVIEFFSGAQVTLIGPCEFGLNSAMRGFLRQGELTAYVPPSAQGFTVGAPGLAVVDLGTRFRMEVDPAGGSHIDVVEGRVNLVLDGPNPQISQLTAGASARFALAHGKPKLEIKIEPPAVETPSIPGLPPAVTHATGDLYVLPATPSDLAANKVESPKILLLAESRGVPIPPGVPAITLPGTIDRILPAADLTPGVRVDSYLLHFDPPGDMLVRATATLTFDRPVVGLIRDGWVLMRTDAAFGFPRTRYTRDHLRGLDDDGTDVLTLSPDRRTITVTMYGFYMDELRILLPSGQDHPAAPPKNL